MTLTQIKPAGLSKPIDLGDNEKIRLGAGNDYEIYFDGSNAIHRVAGDGDLKLLVEEKNFIVQGTGGHQILKGIDNGAVELYYNNGKRLETTDNGILVTGDNSIGSIFKGDLRLKQTSGDTTYVKWDASHAKLEFMDNVYAMFGDANDLEIFHNGSHSVINDNGTGHLQFQVGGTTKAAIVADGVQLYEHLYVQDSDKIKIGNGSDLEIFHDGSNSHLSNITGYLFLQSDNISLAGKSLGENYLVANLNGSVQLYYDSEKKFETFTNGIKVIGPSVDAGGGAASGNIQMLHTDGRKNTFGNHFATNSYDSRIEFGVSDGSTSGGTNRVASISYAGISFSQDTASANRLDDYEEGSFTLTSSAGNGNSIVLNTSYNQGSYTKIGNLVHIQAYLSFSSNSNADSYLQLDSLPFTPADLADGSGHARSVQVAYLNRNYAYLPDGAGYYNVQLYVNESNTWIRLYDLNDKGRRLDTLAKFLGAGADIFLNFSYFAA